MTTYTKRMLVFITMLLMIAGVVVWTIEHRFLKQELLTTQEASRKVETLYAGSVKAFEKRGNIYVLKLERQGTVYNVQVDAKTGNVSALAKVSVTQNNSKLKSEREIRAVIEKQGDVKTILLKKNAKGALYVVEVQQDQSLKSIVVDAKTGVILSENIQSSKTNSVPSTTQVTTIKDTTEATSNNQLSSTPNSPNTSTNVKINEKNASTKVSAKPHTNVKENTTAPKPATATIISQGEAIKIARSQLQGKVDSVEYEKTNDGGYYLVEIDSEEDEAVFQIHAVSGKVLSITHDNQDTTKRQDDKERED